MNRLSTWLRTGKSAPVDESNTFRKVVAEVEERVHRLEIAQKRLAEALELAELSISKLRGRVTGGIRHAAGGNVESIPRGDKAALRRAAGLYPVSNTRGEE